MTVQHTEETRLLPVSHSYSSVCPVPQDMCLQGGTAWQIFYVLAPLITTAQRDAVRDSTQGSADQRPNDSHCLAPQNLLGTGSGPCCPQTLQGQASPPSPAEAVWGLWLGPPIWAAAHSGRLPSPLPPCLSELGVRGWHVHTASPGQGEAGGWGCACSLTEAAYHAVLTRMEAGTCVPCTDR